jgi:hypothetical protein
LKKRELSQFVILMADRKNVESISDIFGSYRINENGEITFLYKGSLLKDLKSYFIVYCDDNDKI